ncbi:MAG: hypothetical protein MZV65_37545 [Chromatiales bacterium]|nr:hypothetical protein [Chromatiales bacterium]
MTAVSISAPPSALPKDAERLAVPVEGLRHLPADVGRAGAARRAARRARHPQAAAARQRSAALPPARRRAGAAAAGELFHRIQPLWPISSSAWRSRAPRASR